VSLLPALEQIAAFVLGGMVESVGKTAADLDPPDRPDTLDGAALRQQIESAVTHGAARGRQQFAADLRASFKTAEALAVFVDQLGRK
jgi:hypothetical protein